MNTHFDIAIIGAGPAGCAAALTLRNSGLKVALIDKDIFPRDKICGDAIPGPAFKAMDKINPIWAEDMKKLGASYLIKTGQVTAPNGKTMKLDWVTFSYNSKRIDFDNYLLELVKKETNTTILENKHMQDVLLDNEKGTCFFTDNTKIDASLIIACDGANSVVRRKLAKEITNNEHACSAVRAYYKDVVGIQTGVNEFHFFNELLPGYFWIFPLDNGWVNIGFGILQKKIAGTKRPVNLRHALNKIITEMPSIAPRFENATMMHDIKSFGLPLGMQQFNISGKRFMLCGDAASLIDPLQGHGIDHAMNSGHIAGLQAIECFASKQFNTEFMQEYDRDVYKKIGGELSRNTFLLRLLSRAPWLLNLVTTIGQHQRFIERIVRFLKI